MLFASSRPVTRHVRCRFYDDESREIHGSRPLLKIGINTEFISISPFAQTLIGAVIVALSQTMGTSIVIFKLWRDFIELYKDEEVERICNMDQARWQEVYSFKILSFLMALVLSFYVSRTLENIQHSGLYEILDRLQPIHAHRINDDDYNDYNKILLGVLYLGQFINNYVCLLAALGSFFIIFEANQGGETTDEGEVSYSHAGLEMILNAVALFFMLELDDVLVSADDYGDASRHLKSILTQYKPDVSMNAAYDSDQFDESDTCICSCCASMESMDTDVQDEVRGRVCRYTIISVFSIFVRMICYVGGFIAPFAILFCW